MNYRHSGIGVGLAALALGLAIASLPPGLAAAQAIPVTSLIVKRSQRQGMTQFEGSVRIPPSLVSVVPGSAAAVYRCVIAVSTVAGREMYRATSLEWVRALQLGRSDVLTPRFAFTVPTGRYVVETTVIDSASGKASVTRTEVIAPPPTATEHRLPAPTATIGRTQRHAAYVVVGATHSIPAATDLEFLADVVGPTSGSVALRSVVLDADGRVVLHGPVLHREGAGGGRSVQGVVETRRLAPAAYTLRVQVGLPDTQLTRFARFAVAYSRPAPFAGLREWALDSLYEPVAAYLLAPDERGSFWASDLEAKRSFLRSYWHGRDRDGVVFYARLEHANRHFGEAGHAPLPGWRTPRGRIYMRNGDPSDVLEIPQRGATPPFQVWKYGTDQSVKYVFVDLTRRGNYVLVYTNDRQERSQRGWKALLGARAVRTALSF